MYQNEDRPVNSQIEVFSNFFRAALFRRFGIETPSGAKGELNYQNRPLFVNGDFYNCSRIFTDISLLTLYAQALHNKNP